MVPSVQPVEINTSFILVPNAGGEGPADQKKASVLLAACKDKRMDLGNGSALRQFLEIPRSAFSLEPRMPHSQAGAIKNCNK